MRLSAEVGLAGISIEDTALPGETPYGFELAVERIKAGAAAARALGRDFVLVARADGILNGQYDVDEAIRRLVAFDQAGADCLYAPMPKSAEDQRRICQATTKPVNALAAGPFAKLSREEFAALGVARISIGAALARLTHRTILDAGKAMISNGGFSALSFAAPASETKTFLE